MFKIINKKYIPLYSVSFIIIFFSNVTIDSALLPRFIALAVILFFLILYLIFKNKSSLQINSFYVFLILYIIYSAITVTYSINKADGVFEFLKIVLFSTLIYTFTLFYKDNLIFFKKFTDIISILTVLVLFIGIFQLFSLYDKKEFSHQAMYQIKSVFTNKNIFAEFLLLLLPVSVYKILYGKKILKIISFLNIVFIIFFSIVLLSRATWVAFILSVFSTFLFLFFFIKNDFYKLINKAFKNKFTWIFLLFFSVITISSVIFYSKKDTFETFEKQVSTFTNFDRIKKEDRVQLWEKTLSLIKEDVIFGHGLSSWKIEILKYGNKNLHSEDNITFYQRPHNDYLWILAEQGLIGLFLYLSLFIILFYYIVKIIKTTENKEIKIYFILNIWILFSFLISSVFNFPRERIEHNILLSILSAVIIIYYNKQNINKRLSVNNRQVRKISLITAPIILFAVFVGIMRMKGEFYVKKAFESRLKNNYKKTIEYIADANSVFYRIDPFSTPIIWYQGEANFYLNNIDAAFKNFKNANEINPNHIHVLNNLATCFELKKDHSSAIKYYKKAIKISPNFDESLLNLCAVYYNTGKIDSVFYYFNKVDTLSSNVKYSQFMYPVLKAVISSVSKTVKDETQKDILLKIQNSETWTNQVYFKSLRNKIDFKKQLLLDVNYLLTKNNPSQYK
ncbi:MAG: hypothetical protein GXO80_08095 [Chlorobi bacterium]|nr:hypothetical protein [Chlorobiota bacterium]